MTKRTVLQDTVGSSSPGGRNKGNHSARRR